MTFARCQEGDSSAQTVSGAVGHRVPEAIHHLAFALSGHVRRLHFQGLPVPIEIEELAIFLRQLVRSRQDSPLAAVPPETGQYSRMPNQLLITKGEAAERLGVSVRTVERLVANGRLPQVHVERLARFRVKDLELFVQGLVDMRSGVDDSNDEQDPLVGAALAASTGG